MLRNLIVSIEILIKEEIKSYPSLKGPASSAPKILNVINQFKNLSAEEQDNIAELNRVIAKIEKLAVASKRNRDNPLVRRLMADSSEVYTDIVNSIAAIKLNKLLRDPVSSPESEQESWIEPSSLDRYESPKEDKREEIIENALPISSSLPSSKPSPDLKALQDEQKLSFSAKIYDDDDWKRPIRKPKAKISQTRKNRTLLNLMNRLLYHFHRHPQG